VTFTCTRQSSPKCLRSFEVTRMTCAGRSMSRASRLGDPSLLPIVVPPGGLVRRPVLDEDEHFLWVESATPPEVEPEVAQRAEADGLMPGDDAEAA
jgi:hypothetical protein